MHRFQRSKSYSLFLLSNSFTQPNQLIFTIFIYLGQNPVTKISKIKLNKRHLHDLTRWRIKFLFTVVFTYFSSKISRITKISTQMSDEIHLSSDDISTFPSPSSSLRLRFLCIVYSRLINASTYPKFPLPNW